MQDGNLNFRKKLFELYELLQDDLSRDIFWLRLQRKTKSYCCMALVVREKKLHVISWMQEEIFSGFVRVTQRDILVV